MFLQLSISHFVHGGGRVWRTGVCVAKRGMPGKEEACVVKGVMQGEGGVHGNGGVRTGEKATEAGSMDPTEMHNSCIYQHWSQKLFSTINIKELC